MGFIVPLTTRSIIQVGLAALMVTVLSGCPEETPVVASSDSSTVKKPTTPVQQPQAPTAQEPIVEPTTDEADASDETAADADEPEDAASDGETANEETPTANPDIIWTDPIDWYFHRIFSRRFFRSGEEFTPIANGDGSTGADDGNDYQPTQKHLRHFNARPLFKLFATNLQKRESVQGQGGGALYRLLSSLFRFRHEDYDISKVLVRITSVEVRQGSTWTTVQDYGSEGRVFDFVALHEGGILELGEFPIDPGSYSRMRLNLGDDNRIVVDEGHGDVDRPLVIPFFQTRKIELVRPFEVSNAGFTSVRVDFDLEQSVYRGFFNAYWLTPVMRIAGVETGTPSSSMINAATGGVVEIMNEVAVVIPPGALTENTQVTIRPVFQLLPHATPDLLILGQEYVLEPEGLQLNAPAQVVMHYRAEHLQALGVDPSSLDMRTRASSSHTWNAAGGTASDGLVQGEVLSFGRMILGGKSADVDMSLGGGCANYGDQVALVPTALGVDPQNFYGECRRQNDCYDHGGRTYGKTADQCLDEFFADMTARCERVCQAGFGESCADISASERASALFTELVGPLHDNCLVVAGRMYEQRFQAKNVEYPAASAQTCDDYAGLGISCETPVCTLDVDQTAIPINTPTDLTFTLSFAGSVHNASFDGSVVYEQAGLALPIEESVTVLDEGRSLSAAKTFTATVNGPANQPAQCSVTVDVIEEPDPCTIIITPESTPAGQQVNLFLTVLPGYNTAYMDIRTLGVMNPIGLSAPDATGNRYFTSNTRPSSTRAYTARVVHDEGDEFTCSAVVHVQ